MDDVIQVLKKIAAGLTQIKVAVHANNDAITRIVQELRGDIFSMVDDLGRNSQQSHNAQGLEEPKWNLSSSYVDLNNLPFAEHHNHGDFSQFQQQTNNPNQFNLNSNTKIEVQAMQSDGIYTKHGLNPLNKVEMTQGNIDNMIILNNIAVQQPTFPTFTEEPQQEIEKDAALSRHQINESHPQSEMSLNVQRTVRVQRRWNRIVEINFQASMDIQTIIRSIEFQLANLKRSQTLSLREKREIAKKLKDEALRSLHSVKTEREHRALVTAIVCIGNAMEEWLFEEASIKARQ